MPGSHNQTLAPVYKKKSQKLCGDFFFFTAFTRDVVKRRSNDFIFLIDDLVYDMIRDENLSEANLRKVFKENLDSVK